MTGERRVDRDFGSLAVADFADHYDVGVLTQEGAQGSRERHADICLHLNLIDARHVILDRILRRHYANINLVHFGEERVKRGRFAGTRRTGH